MAVQKLEKIGYGQLEPHKISAQYTKEVFAQLEADPKLSIIEQGMALVYDQVNGKATTVSKAGKEVVGIVLNEIMLPDPEHQADSDYAMLSYPETPYQVAMPARPKILGLTVGDTFTTNTIKVATEHAEAGSLPVGTKFIADTDGYWKEYESETDTELSVVLQVLKDWTLPDKQRGVKFVVARVKPDNVIAKGE